MANVTISVDDDLLERARSRAARLRTSLNAILRERLEEFVGGDGERQRALDDLFALAVKSKGRSGGRRWSRDDLYQR
jgi:transposase